MTLRTRRFIYIIFITLFLVAAPLLLLYTAGYRYNLKKGKVEQTGALVINSKPDGASVYLNNGLILETTPARVHNLLSNEYLIKVEKEGYFSWQKRLDVYSKQTTFAENIILFRQDEPTLEVDNKINHFSISPNKLKIIYSSIEDQEELWCWNLRDGNKELVLKSPLSSITNVMWLENSNEVFLSQKEGEKINHYVINAKKPDEKTSLNEFAGFSLENVKPEPHDSNIFYGQKENSIYKLNVLSRRIEKIAEIPISNSEQISDYIVKGDEVFYTKTNEEKSILEKITDNSEITPIADLPYWPEAKIKQDKSDIIIIQNSEKQKILVINPDSEFPIYKEVDAKDVVWNEPYDKMIYYSDLEIWTYDIWNWQTEDELFTRYGQIINKSEWYPELGYILFSLDNSINAIEPDPRDKRNINQLLEAEKIDNFILGPRGKDIYFTGTVNGAEGIYKLNIQ